MEIFNKIFLQIILIMKFYFTFLKNLCIINIENDKSTNVVLPNIWDTPIHFLKPFSQSIYSSI